MSTADNNRDVDMPPDICANCGKGEEDSSNSLKACTACKLVKYCNRDCQIVHRSQHKKACRKRAAELHDEKLFKEPPSLYGDCPICFLRLPLMESGQTYMSCCGKLICRGCIHSPVYDNEGNVVADTCPFCRNPAPKSDEIIMEMNERRIELNDAIAIHNRGCDYANGDRSFPQDYDKALELWHKAGELGSAEAYYNIGNAYYNGRGVEVDKNKAKHYWELAAMGGISEARHYLGHGEVEALNYERASRHYMIAVRGGYSKSLEMIKQMYSKGHATKEDYTKALQSYQEYLSEIKSSQRDKAAAADEEYRYY